MSQTSSIETIESVGPDRFAPAEKFFVSDVEKYVKLRLGSSWPEDDQAASLPSVVKRACDTAFELPALRIMRPGGSWETWTYGRFYHDMKAASKAFIKLGLEESHSVCICSFNCPEWFISNVAVIFAGGISCGIPTNVAMDRMRSVLKEIRSNFVVVEDASAVKKVLAAAESAAPTAAAESKKFSELPHLKKIIQIDGDVVDTDPRVISWSELIQLGREIPDGLDLIQRLQELSVNQCCSIVYTAGTTGEPKGVMLSHDNIVWTVLSMMVAFDLKPHMEVFLSYLPLDNIMSLIMDLWLPLFSQGTVCFAERYCLRRGRLLETLLEVRPTRFVATPRILERMQEAVTSGILGPVSSAPRRFAIRRSMQAAQMKHHKQTSSSFWYRIGHLLLYSKVKDSLGLDRCVTLYNPEGTLKATVDEFFKGIDLPVMSGYGLAETTGACMVNWRHLLRSCGRQLPGIRIKLVNVNQASSNEEASKKTELFVHGRSVAMGYLGQEIPSDPEGFFRTGDLAVVDQGNFYITGRVCDLLVTTDLAMVSPAPLEDILLASLPCLSQAMVIGNGRKHLAALLTLRADGMASKGLADAAKIWCRRIGSKAEAVEDVIKLRDERVFHAIQEAIDDLNSLSPSKATRIQNWTLLPREFSGDEIVPGTSKLRRQYIEDKYALAIDKLYA